jgi:broad specificity phosphatase PhoE
LTDERCIYLVRHGETAGESSIRYHGRNDVPLSELGEQQVAGLIPLVRELRLTALVHSPLDRACASARILLEGLQQAPGQIEEVADLSEIFFGDMEGLTAEEIQARCPAWYVEWQAGRATSFPGGESFAGFDQRVATAIKAVLARYPAGDLMVVAHKGIIKRALGALLDLSPEAVSELDPALGSLTVLACGDAVRLQAWSLTASSDPE